MITQAVLQELIHYDAATGDFVWCERPRKYFKSSRDHKWWNGRFAGTIAGRVDSEGYRTIKVFDKCYKAHRLAWVYMNEVWPNIIDHINGVKDDNRAINLRSVDCSSNAKNRKIDSRNKSGVTGAHWNAKRNRWVAKIKVDGKYIFLGSHKTLCGAAEARAAAEIKHGFCAAHGRAA